MASFIRDAESASAPAFKAARSKAQAVKRLRIAQEALADALALDELNHVLRETEAAAAGSDVTAPGRRSALTGEAISATRLQEARRANLLRSFGLRRELLKDSLKVADVARLLGVARQTPHDRVKAKTLLAVEDKGALHFPIWQFDAEGANGVLNGFPAVLQALPDTMSAFARVSWFVSQKPLLEGRTPIQALAAGDVDDVLAEARAVGVS